MYLRRIFENLIDAAHRAAMEAASWDEEKFTACRMSEKIAMLREHLPEFLVEHRSIYSILSKGLHELSEEECKEYFEPVFIGIQLILDELVEKEEARQKIKSVGGALQTIAAKIAKTT